MSCGNKMGGRTHRRQGAPTDVEGLATNTEDKGVYAQPPSSRLSPGVQKWTETPWKPLPFLLTAYLLRATPTLPSTSKASFPLVSKPVASDSLTIPGSFPACISRRTTFATIAVVWKSFFSRTASPHRKNSWFRKIKFRYTKPGST